MALWNRSQTGATLAKPKEIPKWDFAKEITKAEAQSDDLPLGWYYYPDGYIWYGLKPDENNEKLIRSYSQRTPQELVDWLGVPIEETITEEQSAAEETPTEVDLSKKEEMETDRYTHRKAEKRSVTAVRKNSRTKGVMTRFSEQELVLFKRRVAHSGLNQSEYLRRAALTGRIVVEERGASSVLMLDELELLRAEIGRQGGLLKMVVKPNMGQRELAPEEWQELVQAIRHIEKLTKQLSDLQERL